MPDGNNTSDTESRSSGQMRNTSSPGSACMLRMGIPKGHRGFGFDEPRYVHTLDPRLTFIEERFGTQEQVDKMSWPLRITAALFSRWTAQARCGAWVVRYRF